MSMSSICLLLTPSPLCPFYNTLPSESLSYNSQQIKSFSSFAMEFSYPEEYYSKSSSEETDRSSEQNDDTGTGRSYECVFCKRGFTSAQALGGHMNIHRKDRANKTKPSFPSSSSSKVDDNNYSNLGFYPSSPSHLAGGKYYSTAPEVDANNYHQAYFPEPVGDIRPSHEALYVENQRDHLFEHDWRQRNLSLYTNPFCVREFKDKFEDNSEEGGLDLELRLGHHP